MHLYSSTRGLRFHRLRNEQSGLECTQCSLPVEELHTGCGWRLKFRTRDMPSYCGIFFCRGIKEVVFKYGLPTNGSQRFSKLKKAQQQLPGPNPCFSRDPDCA